MKLFWGCLISCVLILALFSCSGPKVIAFTGNNPDFASYYTFRIQHPVKSENKNDTLTQAMNKVETIIARQMQSKGYEKTQVADLVVKYNLILDNKVDYRVDQTSRYGYNYPYYGYGSYPFYPYYLNKNEYTEGMLLVELRESLSNRLVWQASLDLRYRKRNSNRKKTDPVEDAFHIIFSKYPYVAGNSEPQISDNQ